MWGSCLCDLYRYFTRIFLEHLLGSFPKICKVRFEFFFKGQWSVVTQCRGKFGQSRRRQFAQVRHPIRSLILAEQGGGLDEAGESGNVHKCLCEEIR